MELFYMLGKIPRSRGIHGKGGNTIYWKREYFGLSFMEYS